MNESTTTTTPTTKELLEANLCTHCLLVPLSVLALEMDIPIGGWQALFESEGITVLDDHIGRRSVSVLDARRLLRARRRSAELATEDNARRFARLDAKRPPLGGVPAQEGLSAIESLIAAGGVVSPAEEFGDGRQRPDFLREQLAEGQRDLDDKKRLAAERAKERLVKQMKDQL